MAAEHNPYLAHLRRGTDPESTIGNRDAVRSTLQSEGWRLVDELLTRVHEEAVGRLLFGHSGAEGQVLSQAEYARLAGFLSGLRQARVAAEAIVMHAERAQQKETP